MPETNKPPLQTTTPPSAEEIRLTDQVAMLSILVAAMIRVFPRDAMGFHDHLFTAIGEVTGDTDAKTAARKFFTSVFGSR